MTLKSIQASRKQVFRIILSLVLVCHVSSRSIWYPQKAVDMAASSSLPFEPRPIVVIFKKRLQRTCS
jgi:hypothetical protein